MSFAEQNADGPRPSILHHVALFYCFTLFNILSHAIPPDSLQDYEVTFRNLGA
jgi:hypothetical protein